MAEGAEDGFTLGDGGEPDDAKLIADLQPHTAASHLALPSESIATFSKAVKGEDDGVVYVAPPLEYKEVKKLLAHGVRSAAVATRHFKDRGAVGIFTYYNPEDQVLTTANVGDCSLHLIVFDRVNKDVQIVPAFTSHETTNEDEDLRAWQQGAKRIIDSKTYTDADGNEQVHELPRIKSTNKSGTPAMMVTRSFGDRNYGAITQAPSMQAVDFKDALGKPEEFRVLALQMSDGYLRETNLEKVQAYLTEQLTENPDAPVDKLLDGMTASIRRPFDDVHMHLIDLFAQKQPLLFCTTDAHSAPVKEDLSFTVASPDGAADEKVEYESVTYQGAEVGRTVLNVFGDNVEAAHALKSETDRTKAPWANSNPPDLDREIETFTKAIEATGIEITPQGFTRNGGLLFRTNEYGYVTLADDKAGDRLKLLPGDTYDKLLQALDEHNHMLDASFREHLNDWILERGQHVAGPDVEDGSAAQGGGARKPWSR